MANMQWNKLLPAGLAAGVLGWMIGSAVGCELIASVDRTRINQTTAAGGAGGTGMGGMAGQAGEGGTPECSPACPNSTDCQVNDCVDGECVPTVQPEGTTCADGVSEDATVCDDAGACVECNENADCDFDALQPICSNGTCINESCTDGILNNGETGLDDGQGNECGGTTTSGCNPCLEAEGCNVDDDCLSFFCVAGGAGGGGGGGPTGTCEECTAQGDCPTNRFCDIAGTAPDRCEADFIQGAACTIAQQCPGDFCNLQDGVCCSEACAGTCRACLMTKTGQNDGICANVTGGTDLDNECDASAVGDGTCTTANCSGTAAACGSPGAAHVCRNSTGLGSSNLSVTCNPAEVCPTAPGACPADVTLGAATQCYEENQDGDAQCDNDVNCPAGTGACGNPNVANGTDCNDGIFCNGDGTQPDGDECMNGTCSVHDGNPCPGDDAPLQCNDSCNEADDDCTAPDTAGTACDENAAGGNQGTCDGMGGNGGDHCTGD